MVLILLIMAILAPSTSTLLLYGLLQASPISPSYSEMYLQPSVMDHLMAKDISRMCVLVFDRLPESADTRNTSVIFALNVLIKSNDSTRNPIDINILLLINTSG